MRTLVFTYGKLKRGFSSQVLLQELSLTDDATFIGNSSTAAPLPLVCGPYGVPFVLNLPGAVADGGCHRVKGQLYSVTARGLALLDDLEGVSRGHCERLPVSVVLAEGGGGGAVEGAVAYYAHRGYAAEMWARSGWRVHAEYSPAVTVGAGYVDRPKRPPGVDLPPPDRRLPLLSVLVTRPKRPPGVDLPPPDRRLPLLSVLVRRHL